VQVVPHPATPIATVPGRSTGTGYLGEADVFTIVEDCGFHAVPLVVAGGVEPDEGGDPPDGARRVAPHLVVELRI
jgi:hypothetical protein